MTARANSDANVSTGKPRSGGAVWHAPASTALPTDATTALAAAYENLGYISEEGVVEKSTQNVGDHKAWGGQVVETSQTESKMQITMEFVEVNTDTQGIVWGASNVTGTDGAMTIIKGKLSQVESVIVVETLMKGARVSRKVYPRCKLNLLGDVAYQDNKLVGFKCTFDVLWYETFSGFGKEFIATPSSSSGGGA